MPLDFQTLDVKFTDGLDTHEQRKLVVSGKWDTLINYSLSEDGSLRRRDGYDVLIASQAGNGLATRDDELLIIDGPDLSTVSEVGTNLAKQVPGQLPYVDIEKREVIADGLTRDMQDMAYGNGFACYVWRSRTSALALEGIRCSVVDLSTGAKLVNNVALFGSATIVSPRVVFADNAFFIFSSDTANLYCAVIATSAPTTIGANVSIVLDANLVVENFDACVFNGAPLIAYRYNDGTTSVQARSVTRAGTVPTASAATDVITEADVTNASIHAICCAPYASANAGVFVVHTAGGALAGGLVGAVLDTSLAVSTAATLVDGTVPPVATDTHVTAVAVGSNIQTFFDQQSSYLSANLRPLRSGVWTSTLTTSTAAYTLVNSACYRINAAEASGPQGPFIAGKAFVSGGVAFLPVAMLENYARLTLGTNTDTTSSQCAFFVLRCEIGSGTNFTTVGGALYRTLGAADFPLFSGAAPVVSTPPSTPALSSGFGICLQEKERLALVNGINASPIGLAHITMTPRTATPGAAAQLAETTYFSGGQLGAYDGRQIAQQGFPMFPEGISAVVSAPGGATKLTVGVHQVLAVYEWTDGAGNRHQSAPSLPVRVTVANATDQIDVIVPTTQLAQSAGWDASVSTLSIVCYMTLASGLAFYRAITSFVPVANNPLVSNVTYTIGAVVMTDDRLAQNELLYTQPNQAGATLPNLAPGPMHGIAVSQKRLWGFRSDRPLEYAWSQEPLPSTGLQFNNDVLGDSLPADSGGGVAIAPLDEKTILFGERQLYAVFGTGPTPSGGFNNFSEPQLIPSDVGCREPRSVIDIPAGLMFKSAKGFYLLGRDLSVRYIGEGVRRWDAYDVTAAVMMEDRQEVRFTSSNVACPTLVYSYLVNQWSVFYYGNLLHPGAVVGAAWWPATGKYVHLHPTGAPFVGLMQDTPDAYIDAVGDGTPTVGFTYARTGWLHLATLESFQRVRRLYLTGTAATSPTTSLSLSVDFDDMYDGDADGAYTLVIDLSAITFDNVEAIDLRHKLARQKCKSVAFTFYDAGGASSVVPLKGLQAMGLEIGRKRGLNKLIAAQTVG